MYGFRQSHLFLIEDYNLGGNDYRCKSLINSKTFSGSQKNSEIKLAELIPAHEITDITYDPDFSRVQDHGRLTAVHISKHSPFS